MSQVTSRQGRSSMAASELCDGVETDAIFNEYAPSFCHIYILIPHDCKLNHSFAKIVIMI